MQRSSPKTVLCMVGLPARGKSFIARKVARYLNWRGQRCRIFNVGRTRRQRLGARQADGFFDPDNDEARQARMDVASVTLDELLTWLHSDGQVGIFDATNSTSARRQMIIDRCERAGVALTFIEVVCNAADVIDANIRSTKLQLPDFEGLPVAEAERTFRQRLAQYQRAYQPLEDEQLSWIKLIVLPAGHRRIVINRVAQPQMMRVAQLLVGFQSGERTIWLTRHGESTHNVGGRIGGDPPLSTRGRAFRDNLARWFEQQSKPVIWCSTMQRALQTAEGLGGPDVQWRALEEIDAGVCDGLTYDEIRQQMPDEFAARQADKLRYRYPRGESYLDVIQRLDPVIAELERFAEPLLVIAHQAVLRAVYGYLAGKPREDVPHLKIPLHTIIELAPGGIDPRESRHPLGPD